MERAPGLADMCFGQQVLKVPASIVFVLPIVVTYTVGLVWNCFIYCLLFLGHIFTVNEQFEVSNER